MFMALGLTIMENRMAASSGSVLENRRGATAQKSTQPTPNKATPPAKK
jgi:hypothetical protein